MLGIWLADGNRCCGSITSMLDSSWLEIEKRGYKLGNTIQNCGKASTKTVLGLYTQLKKLNLLKNKHIPDIYLLATEEERWDLLRGYMDGDGHFHKKRKSCVMTTTSLQQKEDMVKLLGSLGLLPIVFNFTVKGFGLVKEGYQIRFSTKKSPFLSRNTSFEKAVENIKFNRNNFRYIKSIEKVETVPTKCLEVESDCHTYLVGHGFIKTHNTNKEIKMSNPFQRMLDPVGHLEDTNYNHYNIQLSLYAYILEEWGYICKGMAITHHPTVFDEEFGLIRPVGMPTVYKFEYLKKEVEDMLKWHFK